MMIALLNSYLSLNILLVIAYLLLRYIKLSPNFTLRFQYFSVLSLLFLSLVQPLLPKPPFVGEVVKVWAADRMENIETSNMNISKIQTIGLEKRVLTTLPKETPYVLWSIVLLVFFVALYLITKEIKLLQKIIATSFLYKKFGKIRVLIHDDITTPFSFWFPGFYYTVIPSALLHSDKNDFNISLYHEFQHHRQEDTKFIHLLLFIKALCFFNPCAFLLAKLIGETQELACDDKMIEKNKASTQHYMGCLIRVAQNSITNKINPVCAAGFCFFGDEHILRRRIQMLLKQKKPVKKWLQIFSFTVVTILFSLTAFASRNLLQDKRISHEEAKTLVEKASEGTDFPIVLNEEVLTQLNRYLGTVEGRNFMKSALLRKKQYEETLAKTSAKYQTPTELNAIPIAESGYQNLPSRYSVKAAGLWMFIPGTAQKSGMNVNKKVDERLNTEKQTDAAHRYLLSNKLLFDDWLLAIYAYNVGEGALAKGIAKHGTRDVWELSKHVKGDKDYMAKVMASMIIMKNPEVLN